MNRELQVIDRYTLSLKSRQQCNRATWKGGISRCTLNLSLPLSTNVGLKNHLSHCKEIEDNKSGSTGSLVIFTISDIPGILSKINAMPGGKITQ